MQPDPSQGPTMESPITTPPPASTPEPSKKSGMNLQVIFLVVLILATAGLGYWAMQSNNALKAAQSDLAALQVKYDDLSAQKDAVSKEFDATSATLNQTTSELDQTNQEIAAAKESTSQAKSELAKTNNEITALKKKMQKAFAYVDIMKGIFVDSDNDFVILIKTAATGDQELSDLFSAFLKSPTQDNLLKFFSHLLNAALDTLTK